MSIRSMINKGITLSAMVGVVIVAGTIGNVDYLTTVGQDCSLMEIIKSTVVGLLFIVPAIVREVKIYIG